MGEVEEVSGEWKIGGGAKNGGGNAVQIGGGGKPESIG